MDVTINKVVTGERFAPTHYRRGVAEADAIDDDYRWTTRGPQAGDEGTVQVYETPGRILSATLDARPAGAHGRLRSGIWEDYSGTGNHPARLRLLPGRYRVVDSNGTAQPAQ